MIDFHCHILYGLDDGADSLEESVEMAKIAHEDGVRHIFATPHFNANFLVDQETVTRRVASFQQTLDTLGIPVKIHPGNEVRLENKQFVYEHFSAERYCLLGPSRRFVLLEQRWNEYEPDSPEIVRWFMQNGIRPIIPHPERHFFFRENPELLDELVALGAWMQVNADSIVGNNGEEIREFSRELAEQNLIHMLATDAHNVRRKPNLSAGFRIVREWCGEEKATEIHQRAYLLLE